MMCVGIQNSTPSASITPTISICPTASARPASTGIPPASPPMMIE